MKKLLVVAVMSAALLYPVLTVDSGQPAGIISDLVSESYGPIAKSGCCSWHGGVCGCNSYGGVECCDGTTSPSCTCNSLAPLNPFSITRAECETGVTLAQGTTYVQPYVRKDGTAVQGHYRTAPDNNHPNN